MMEVLFWFVYVLTPVSIGLLMRIAKERVLRISIISVTVVALYLFSVVGILPLFYQWDATRVNSGVVDQGLVLNVLLFSFLNINFFLVGVIFEKKTSKRKLTMTANFLAAKPPTKRQLVILLIFFLVSFFVFLSYISKFNELAIFTAINSGATDAGVVRSEMSNDFSGKYHWYKFFMYSVSQFVAYILFANWIWKSGRLNFVLFSVAFFYAAFVAIAAVEKAPLLWFFVGLYMTHALVKNNGIVKFGKIAPLLIVLTVSLVLMYQYFMGAGDIEDALGRIISRAFSGSISPAYFYLEYFPDVAGYLYGATIPNPGGILPYTPVRYTVDVMNWVFPSLASRGVVGSMPTVFWGESYANFGPFGIPVIAFFMGLIVSKINSYILGMRLNGVIVGFYVWIILEIKNISESGFGAYIYNIQIISMLFLVFVLLRFGRKN
ncbi:hypothetical protein [Acidovorax sp. 210-6]|uniref:hypothetical protein n=1 Tax=Acidovorax sp. 210-6 TaxID=2699468 RepID=UPI001389CFFF|nr:hypothetical protein [Acidovorax sp. 210-6]